ncbi:aspartate kinase [Acaryochloris sp. 'Moss Beach']|uniref:aspartate kinase n=1 Tax=Acaryochloris sp. 'Moss Beach' TaxID=2740837 RepID=UPI001F38489B|nr:aspartate kinase [Acaryochloris sp. 'Moss Beach']UJB70128.1 aspartate kinase [Acaryochloris sp. 'Moss Beach']
MGLIVQKFGGTSVGSVERIKAVAQRVKQTVVQGNSVVVVVSAMGKSTDTLVQLAQGVSSNPCRREMDMLLSTGEQVSISLLSMALQELGQPAISLTGAQVGIVTEPEHTRARILHIATERLERHLNEGKVVVVAGFQGTSNTSDLEVTTLGRGGSDTSAVALAAALNAEKCEIYTDVAGVLTTDPRLVEKAQLMEEITCEEMLELASLGANVLHPRAVEIARNYGVQMAVRSSWTDEPGTQIISTGTQPKTLTDLELGRPVDAVHFDLNQAKVALLHVTDRPGVAAGLFGELANQHLDVDLIIQSIHDGNSNDIAFTVAQDCCDRVEAVATAFSANLPTGPASEVLVEPKVAKVSIVGAGIIGRPQIAAQMFQTLSDLDINLQMISTSEVNVSCTIAAADCERATKALCDVFEVTSSSIDSGISLPDYPIPPVRGVALDLEQAQLAIRNVPDHPGMAAHIFQVLAKRNISVDMIIQSQRSRQVEGQITRDIAFTVAEGDLEVAQGLLLDLSRSLGCGEVASDSAIAKVSIVGIGMLGQPGVAAQMFVALAQQKINIQMIATSEIRVSCVVAQEDGSTALQAIHKAFGLEG